MEYRLGLVVLRVTMYKWDVNFALRYTDKLLLLSVRVAINGKTFSIIYLFL